jgi:hypothetical protein
MAGADIHFGAGGVKHKGFTDDLLGMNREQQERIAGNALWIIFPAIVIGLILIISYAILFPEPVPKQITTGPYDGPAGCPKKSGDRFDPDVVEGCFSPKNLIQDYHKKGLRMMATGKRGLARYYRIENNAVLVACGKGLDLKIHCNISHVEKNVFVVRSESE